MLLVFFLYCSSPSTGKHVTFLSTLHKKDHDLRWSMLIQGRLLPFWIPLGGATAAAAQSEYKSQSKASNLRLFWRHGWLALVSKLLWATGAAVSHMTDQAVVLALVDCVFILVTCLLTMSRSWGVGCCWCNLSVLKRDTCYMWDRLWQWIWK